MGALFTSKWIDSKSLIWANAFIRSLNNSSSTLALFAEIYRVICSKAQSTKQRAKSLILCFDQDQIGPHNSIIRFFSIFSAD